MFLFKLIKLSDIFSGPIEANGVNKWCGIVDVQSPRTAESNSSVLFYENDRESDSRDANQILKRRRTRRCNEHPLKRTTGFSPDGEEGIFPPLCDSPINVWRVRASPTAKRKRQRQADGESDEMRN